MNALPVTPIPRDLEIDGRHYTELYRTHRHGGYIIYLQSPPAGFTFPFRYHVIAIRIDDKQCCEELGDTIAVKEHFDEAVNAAYETLQQSSF
jgi:hypothetical protein